METLERSHKKLDLTRPRSEGPLEKDDYDWCRSNGVQLSYDPTAYGWVTSRCDDDIALAPASRLEETADANDAKEIAELNDFAAGLIADWKIRRLARGDLETRMLQAADSAAMAQSGATDRVRLQCVLQQRVFELLHDEGALSKALWDPAKTAMLEEKYGFRPWAQTDVDRFVSLLDDPEIWVHLDETYPDPLTAEYARELIDLSNNLPTHEVLAVEFEGEVVGQVRLQFEGAKASPGAAVQDAEVSYWLGRPYWGKGLMSDIVRLYTSHCFRSRGVRSISAWVRESNKGSIRVLEKSGYRSIGKEMSVAACGPGYHVYRAFRWQYVPSVTVARN